MIASKFAKTQIKYDCFAKRNTTILWNWTNFSVDA
jgi:hypothetical protein